MLRRGENEEDEEEEEQEEEKSLSDRWIELIESISKTTPSSPCSRSLSLSLFNRSTR
jgi:hypothetical protein